MVGSVTMFVTFPSLERNRAVTRFIYDLVENNSTHSGL